MPALEDIRQRTWDFALTVVTVAVLGLLGLQSFVGTAYVWWAERSITSFEQSAAYATYVARMDAIAAPLVVALVVVMGLCVPKRLFSRRLLLGVSAVMVAAGVAAGLAARSLGEGLAVYLALAAVIQVAVVAMTVAGIRGPSYLTQGRLTKTGSGLLHLGFIVFAIVVVALQKSAWMMPVFTVSAVLMGGGIALAFYADKLAWRRPGVGGASEDAGQDADAFDSVDDGAEGERFDDAEDEPDDAADQDDPIAF